MNDNGKNVMNRWVLSLLGLWIAGMSAAEIRTQVQLNRSFTVESAALLSAKWEQRFAEAPTDERIDKIEAAAKELNEKMQASQLLLVGLPTLREETNRVQLHLITLQEAVHGVALDVAQIRAVLDNE